MFGECRCLMVASVPDALLPAVHLLLHTAVVGDAPDGAAGSRWPASGPGGGQCSWSIPLLD